MSPVTRLNDDPNQPCGVEGCDGSFGPGCMAPPSNPLYFKCKHNRLLAARIWNTVATGEVNKEKP